QKATPPRGFVGRMNGLRMVLRRRNLGRCLVLASSLVWAGCTDLSPRAAGPAPAPFEPPQTAPALQIAGLPETAPPDARDATLPHPRPPGKGRAVLLPPVPPHWDTVPGGLSLHEVESASPLRRLHRQAVERFAATPAYSARLRRRERWEDKERPEELILFKYRKEPFSLYLRWLGSEAKGREVLYVKGRDDDLLTI